MKNDIVDRKREDLNPEDKTERQKPASLSPRQHHGEDTHISVDKTEKKLTFETTCVKKNNVNMNDRISRFQELVDKRQVWVTGSGRCASHNLKLVRDIVSKKQSFVDKSGGIGGKLSDFTDLVCPTKLSNTPGKVNIEINTETALTRTGETTNQNTELPGSGATNQSPAGPKKMRDNT